ncbi:MAG: TIGR00730 family Rossman fold protein [Actinomycetota bacterium]|nr:TIGR00730 family Rossman fold protein [Actinomycetota bacterium]
MLRVCVFCGSNTGARAEYRQAARAFADLLVAQGIDLVYGGSSLGLMGELADAVRLAGGNVTGVIPRQLLELEAAHPAIDDLRIVDSMHERKALMFDLADGFIAMPGGLGTLEELFEILTWLQLGLHAKPAGILDVADYFAPLVAFLDQAVREGFVQDKHRRLVLVDDRADHLLERMRAFEPPRIERWIGEEAR